MRVSRETRETRAAARDENAPLLSRAFSRACGHFRVARFARRTKEKREIVGSL